MRRQNEESQAREELESGSLDRWNGDQLSFYFIRGFNFTFYFLIFIFQLFFFIYFEVGISQFHCNEECVEQLRKLLESCFDILYFVNSEFVFIFTTGDWNFENLAFFLFCSLRSSWYLFVISRLVQRVSHFRAVFCVFLKTSPGAWPFVWKWVRFVT